MGQKLEKWANFSVLLTLQFWSDLVIFSVGASKSCIHSQISFQLNEPGIFSKFYQTCS